MGIITKIKRAKYFGAAAVLMLASVPMVPSGRVYAAELSDNLTLSGDSDECYTIPVDKTVTLDLSGHTLQCGVVVEAGANLTITGDGTITTSAAESAAIYNKVGGTVTIENGAFSSANWYTVKNLGTMTINDGTFSQGTANSSNASMIANGWYNGKNSGASDQGNTYTGALANLTINGGTFNHYTTTSTIKSDDYSKTVINGGMFSSNQGYLIQATGDVTVNGGDFTGYSSLVVFNATGEDKYEPGVATINDATVNATYLASGRVGTLNVNGGEFTGLREVIKTGSTISNNGIAGGQFNIPVEEKLAEGKATWKTGDNTYEVLDASDAKDTLNKWMLAKVGEVTMVPSMSERVKNYSDFKVVGSGTFADGAYTPVEAGKYEYIRVFPRVCRDENGIVTCGKNEAEDNYEATIRFDTYSVEEIGNKVIAVGETAQIPEDTVVAKEGHTTVEYSVEDESIATVDEDGEITATGTGQTDVYVTITSTQSRGLSVREKIGTVYVYDFSGIEDTYLIEKDETLDIAADENWRASIDADNENVGIASGQEGWVIQGLEAGVTTVTWTVNLGGETKTKEAKVYVYEVEEEEILAKKGDRITAETIEEMINKDEDVAIEFLRTGDEGVVATEEDGELTLTAKGVGEATATYLLSVDGVSKTVEFKVYVWNFVSTLEERYDLGNLVTRSEGVFKFYDEYEGAEVSYAIKDAEGEEIEGLKLENLADSSNLVVALEGAAPGMYTLEVTDYVNGELVDGDSAEIYVHEIETNYETEKYIILTHNPLAQDENAIRIRATEENGFTATRDITAEVAGSVVDGITAEFNRRSGNWMIIGNRAGSYTITFSDGYASTMATVYVMDFTFGEKDYYVTKEDSPVIIEAINDYWHELNDEAGLVNTKITVVADEDGNVVSEDEYDYGARMMDSYEKYTFDYSELEAGNYTVTFEAYANGRAGVATKNVNLHIYEMNELGQTVYFVYAGEELDIEALSDKNDEAHIRATILDEEGNTAEAEAISFKGRSIEKISTAESGVYTVRYTDYMDNGRGGIGNTVGTADVTIVVIELEEEEIFVRKGETVEISGSEDWEASYVVDENGNEYEATDGVAEVDTTEMELGEYAFCAMHEFSEYDSEEAWCVKETAVVVWDVAGDEGDDMDSDEDREAVAEFVAEHIEAMLKNESVEDEQIAWGFDDVDELKDLLREGAEITTVLEVYTLDEDEWGYAEAYDEVVIKLEDGEEIVIFYEAYLEVYADGEWIGTIYETDLPITMRLEVPEEALETADGYTRTFSVIRGHLAIDGTETGERLEATLEGNELVFLNNKFSSFAISFIDTLNPVTPETGFVTSEGGSASSSNLVAAIVAMLGMMTMVGAAIFAKRK